MPLTGSPRFEDIAVHVGREAARLLIADVDVVDESGTVVSRSASPRANAGRSAREVLRVPIELDSQRGVVVVFGCGGRSPVPQNVARALIDLMVTQAVGSTSKSDYRELRDKFILDLVTGVLTDDEEIARDAQILEMDLTPPRAVILIDASSYILESMPYESNQLSHRIARRRAATAISVIASFFKLPNHAICGYIGNGEVAVLKAASTQDLAPWTNGDSDRGDQTASWANLAALKRAAAALQARLHHDLGCDIHVAIGRYHAGMRGLSSSYHDAALALALGSRLHSAEDVHCLDSLGIAAFVGVSDSRTKSELAAHLLAPIAQEPDLVRTLEAYFEHDCSPTATSAELGIHRNTLGYRLDRVTHLVGLNVRNFDQAVQLRAAMVLSSLNNV